MQARLSKISSDCDIDGKTDIHFTTKAKKLGTGLSEQLAAFLDTHPRTKLIVIDTAQYIRNTGKFTGTYAKDYQDMDALRAIISGRKVTMLLITHTRKTGDADPVNLISGSTGLSGAAGGVFVLEKKKRSESLARLTIANRDTESHQFDLRFDSGNCRWRFVAKTGADDDEDRLYDLLNLLLDETPVWRGSATQLYAALTALDPSFPFPPISLSKALKNQQDFLKSNHGIICAFTRNKTARTIELSRGAVNAECLIATGHSATKAEPITLAG